MQFTDFLGKPINADNTIVHAVAVGSSPRLEKATVVEVVPLIADPYGRVLAPALIREDQVDKDEPTHYRADSDPTKHYIVKAVKPHWCEQDRLVKVTITRTNNVVVV